MSSLSLREFIGELSAEGTTVFLTTHYIEEADQLSDRIAILVNGKVSTIDTSDNIKRAVRGTPIIEVLLSEDPSENTFEDLKNLGEVEIDGRRIGIETVRINEAIESLIKTVSQNGLRIVEVNTISPTLEDAFVKLTGVTPETMKIEKERRR